MEKRIGLALVGLWLSPMLVYAKVIDWNADPVTQAQGIVKPVHDKTRGLPRIIQVPTAASSDPKAEEMRDDSLVAFDPLEHQIILGRGHVDPCVSRVWPSAASGWGSCRVSRVNGANPITFIEVVKVTSRHLCRRNIDYGLSDEGTVLWVDGCQGVFRVIRLNDSKRSPPLVGRHVICSGSGELDKPVSCWTGLRIRSVTLDAEFSRYGTCERRNAVPRWGYKYLGDYLWVDGACGARFYVEGTAP